MKLITIACIALILSGCAAPNANRVGYGILKGLSALGRPVQRQQRISKIEHRRGYNHVPYATSDVYYE